MDKHEFILSTVRRMAQYTFPYLTSVIGVVDERTGRHLGSGLRCILRGHRVVVTALHVIEAAAQEPRGFALSAGYGFPPYLVAGNIRTDALGDLAVYYLPDDYPADREDISFWPEERIEPSSPRLSTDYLFVHGFPAERSRFFSLLSGVASKSLPYGVMQRLENLPPGLAQYQFALDFDPANMKLQSAAGQTDAFVNPHGLSGSPIWRTGISGGSAEAWTTELSLVVGFLTQWRPDDKVLVATLASRLMETAGTASPGG
jgi:hypothetical protein